MKNSQRGFVNIYLAIAILVIVGVLGFMMIKKSAPVEVSETADWKTYTSEKYGFEIKYPESMKMTNTSTLSFGGFDFDSNIGTNIKMFIKQASVSDSIEKYLIDFDRKRAESKDKSLLIEVQSAQSMKINGFDAVIRAELLGDMKMPTENVYLLHNGYFYQLSVWVNAIEWYNTYNTIGKRRPIEVDAVSVGIFENMLKTFKFTK